MTEEPRTPVGRQILVTVVAGLGIVVTLFLVIQGAAWLMYLGVPPILVAALLVGLLVGGLTLLSRRAR